MLLRRAMTGWIAAGLLPFLCTPAFSQALPAAPARDVRAGRAQSIVVDGRLDEEAWRRATPVSGFVQSDPDEGRPATEPTEVRVLYDDRAIYVGLRLIDDRPDQVSRRLARRDTTPDADWVMVYLD